MLNPLSNPLLINYIQTKMSMSDLPQALGTAHSHCYLITLLYFISQSAFSAIRAWPVGLVAYIYVASKLVSGIRGSGGAVASTICRICHSVKQTTSWAAGTALQPTSISLPSYTGSLDMGPLYGAYLQVKAKIMTRRSINPARNPDSAG